MSVDLLSQILKEDISKELIITNQLLQNISRELHQIKEMTSPGGEFEANIANNAVLVRTLASLQRIDIDKLPPLPRMQIGTKRNNSNSLGNMDESR